MTRNKNAARVARAAGLLFVLATTVGAGVKW